MHSILEPNTPIQVSENSLAILRAECSVRAGFPSPAEDFQVRRIELADLLVEHPQATYIMKVRGLSVTGFGIDDGDWVVVDRAVRPRHRHLVVADIEGEMTLKRLYSLNGIVKLEAGNDTFPDIFPRENQTLQIWGVVRNSIRSYL